MDSSTSSSTLLTAAQHTAIHEHERNLIVVAGAGSGKTYVLVERFLTLLDQHPDWPLNSLVAITFTKKAAQEMRDRVRRALEERYQKTADTPEVQEIWAAHIANMTSARIDTIHGLCSSILRANAAEVGIDPGFQVMEEIDSRLLIDACIDTALQQMAHEGAEAAYLFTQYEPQTMRQVLVNLINEPIPAIEQDIITHWNTIWANNARSIITQLRLSAEYQRLSSWKPAHGWPTGSERLAALWKACEPWFTVLNGDNSIEVYHEAILQLASFKMPSGRIVFEGVDECKTALNDLRTLSKNTVSSIGDKLGDIDNRTARLVPLWMKLIQQTQQTYRERKEADSLLDFDDLEQLTRALLVSSKTVRDRYKGSEFKHLLVDEFQDTNRVQWEIVQGLADIETGGSLFVVGDPKQSIYQFRGADVSVFMEVKGQITQYGGIDVPLATSFRTHKRLVDGFNDIFSKILVRDVTSFAYPYEVDLGTTMEANRPNPPADLPPIELIYLDKNTVEEKLDAEAMRRWEAYELAVRLKQIVDVEKRPIYDKERRVVRQIGYGDIAILFQSTSNIVLYEEVFKTLRLPYVTIAGRGYYGRQEVWDLVNLLTALHNPDDNLALASALRSPLFGFSDDTLLELRLQRDPVNLQKRLPLWAALNQAEKIATEAQEKLDFARTCLNRLHDMAGRVSIADLLQSALDETGYLAILTGLPDGTRRRNNVGKLLEKAQASRQVTLGAFSQYLRDLSVREVREGEAILDVSNSVTLMTVHASKGLEYPLVALVDIGWNKGNNSGSAVMVDPLYGLVCKVYDGSEDKLISGYAYQQAERLQQLRETAERKRLLYVAATRAQDYLILSGQEPKNSKETWLGWVKAALELANELAPGIRVLEKTWGHLHITVPTERPLEEALEQEMNDGTTVWDKNDIGEIRPLPGGSQAPLTTDIRIRHESIRHITATQIADAGGAQYDPFYRHKFRRSVFQVAPDTIDQIRQRRPYEVSQRIIGEMVHRVLGWWQFDQPPTAFDDRLDSYAWELGVVDTGQRKYAIQEAHKLLDKMMASEVYGWLRNAVQIYQEIPFVYRSEKRIVHGVLDVLFQKPDGSWAILDYKTSHVRGYKSAADKNLVSTHALRYHLQIGVYAAAVREQLGGIVPDTYIYYIRYGQYVNVHEADWTNALNGMEATIGDLLDG